MKLPYVATCVTGADDTIAVDDYTAGGEVVLLPRSATAGRFSVYLFPDDARRLAKALKKAAKRAEAGE